MSILMNIVYVKTVSIVYVIVQVQLREAEQLNVSGVIDDVLKHFDLIKITEQACQAWRRL